MSLIAKFPLINSDINLGGEYNILTTGLTFDTTLSKIGSGSLKVSSSSIQTSIPYTDFFPTFTDVSFCGWFYFNSIELQNLLDSITYTDSSSGLSCNLLGYGSYGGVSLVLFDSTKSKQASDLKLFLYVRNNGPSFSLSSAYAPIILNSWNHYCLAFSKTNKTLSFYINGNLFDKKRFTSQGTSYNSTNNFFICHSGTWGGNGPSRVVPCYVNDVQVYNHCLSSKEVKEISKCLICHLPLDNNGAGMPNLLTKSADLTQWSKTSNTTVAWDESKKLYKATYTGTDTTRYGVYQDLNIEANTTYTVSCTLEGVSCGVAFGCYDSSVGWPTTVIAVSGDKVRKSYTLTSGANSTKARVFLLTNASTSKEVWFELPKLEKSSVATPWCPHTSDALYSSLGFDSSTIYDTSGYCNNGTMSSNKPTIDSNSPRYNTCMLFNGSNNYIICGRGSMVRDAITVNVWAYMDNWSTYNRRIASCTESGGWNFEPGSSKMNFAIGTGTSSCTYKSVLSSQTLASLSGWVMFTGTYDGFNSKIYINGVLSNTTAAYTTKTPIFYNANNGLFIGAEAVSSPSSPGGSYFNGKISDFRIYATALSAEDIAELYKVPISIDNTNKIFTMDYAEI